MNFVKIPGKDYEFQTTLVTQEQWEKVMGNNPSFFKVGPNLPVEQVSFDDCMEFIKRLNEIKDGYSYRLPTEEEWEHACRAGTTTDFYFPEKDIDDYAWYYRNSKWKTHPVGLKKPNAYGLYDMSGLLWEWSISLYDSTGPSQVLRGGSWDNGPVYLRSACRYGGHPSYRDNDVGLRLLRQRKEFDCIQKINQEAYQKNYTQNLNHVKNVDQQKELIDTTRIIKSLKKLCSYVENITLKDTSNEVIGDGDLKSIKDVLYVKSISFLKEITISLKHVDENVFKSLEELMLINDGNLVPSESERAKLREALREFKKKRPTFGEIQAFKLGFKKGNKK